ncbi:MAG: hypothetical protein JSW03_11490 [Candidatus Eiseniibacteriota bacterium]|nr:MAG: hypothetical protein JSW03_11490 [Candidatus Eisenbacteria bacterium]
MKRNLLLVAIAVLLILQAGSLYAATATRAPSWYFTVPKADAVNEKSFIVGFPYIEYSPTQGLELGLHGIKYAFQRSSSYPLAVGIDPILGTTYAYAVWGLPTSGNSDLTVGVKVFPFFLLLGFETQIDENVSFLLEANDGVMAGLRVVVDPHWFVEFGAGLTAYGTWRLDRRGIHDYDFDDVDFEPALWLGFGYSDYASRLSSY